MSATQWFMRAERALNSATLLLDEGDDADRACSTAYYAMFYAARAALFSVGQPERALGKTHSGMAAAFNEFVVRPGSIAKECGSALSHELNRRLVADYDADGVSIDAAREALVNAIAFVAAVRNLSVVTSGNVSSS